MADDEVGAAFEFLLPWAGLGEVSLDDAKLGVKLL
jgi:hypothetical protein